MKISILFFLTISVFMVVPYSAMAQDSTQHKTLIFSGFIDGYYAYDFDKPLRNNRPAYLYNHNRHNEFSINLALAKAAYDQGRVRANLALGFGTYMNANYSAEPATLKNIYEANAGLKLHKRKDLWFDIGIFPSHIGFESAISKDCWTLTRSIVAENSPYFESGAKLTYRTTDQKLMTSLLALNGWQRITRVEGNSIMSWGTQVQLKPSESTILNYSTFFGSDKPDTTRQFRHYHNFYGIFNLTSKFAITAGFDFGFERDTLVNEAANKWFSPVLILKIMPSDFLYLALRGEYFQDKDNVLVTTKSDKGFRVAALSLNVDYMPEKNIVIRLEGKILQSPDEIFMRGSKATRTNSVITFSTALTF